jgi:hypothetical protein
VFVEEMASADLTDALTEILRAPPTPVSAAERDQVLERFSWKRIMEAFWEQL